MSNKEMDGLIVRHLLDLENAAARLQNELGNAILEKIDGIVQQWIATRTDKWFFKGNSDSAYAYCAPESWRIAESTKKQPEYFGYFQFGNAPGSDETEFYLTSMCNLKGGPFGIEWLVKLNESGMNRSAWRKFIQPEIPRLRDLGFRHQEKNDMFFVPTSLSQENLALAIENDAIEDALDPIRQGLKVIDGAFAECDRIMRGAIKRYQTTT